MRDLDDLCDKPALVDADRVRRCILGSTVMQAIPCPLVSRELIFPHDQKASACAASYVLVPTLSTSRCVKALNRGKPDDALSESALASREEMRRSASLPGAGGERRQPRSRVRSSPQCAPANLLQLRVRHLLPLLLLPLLYYVLRPPRIPFHHVLPSPTRNLTFSPTLDRQIPPYVHFVFGLSPTFGGKPFNFIHFLSLVSALKVLHPEVIFMHHVFPPRGFWWEESMRMIEGTGTRLEMVKQRDVEQVYGNEISHFAHKADVIRLEVLRDYGGVYLDMDVLVLRGKSHHIQSRADK